jgi:hypothetical protein
MAKSLYQRLKPRDQVKFQFLVGAAFVALIIALLVFYSPAPSSWYMVDFHTHDSDSGDNNWSFLSNMNWHEEKGFDLVFLTTHVFGGNILPNTSKPAIPLWNSQHSMQIVPSIEWTSSPLDILMLNVPYWNLTVPSHANDSNIIAAVNYCHSQGGLAIVAHPQVNNIDIPHMITDLGCDGVEITNSIVIPHRYDGPIPSGSIQTSGSDSHGPTVLAGISHLASPTNPLTQIYAGQIINENRPF